MEWSERFLKLSRFWVQRVLVPILVFIGAGGNIVTVMVLTRRRMRCSTNIYLTALAVADLIYLLFVLILSFEHYPNIHDIRYELYWRFYGINHWLADAASSASIWLVVCFTVERYIAVCHPIRGKVLCTENRAKRVIAAVSILCILSTISTSFEYQLTTSPKCLQKICDDDELTPHKDENELNTTISQEEFKNKGTVTSINNLEVKNNFDEEEPFIGNETKNNPDILNDLLINQQSNYLEKKQLFIEELNKCINDTGQNFSIITCLNDTSQNNTFISKDCCIQRREIQTELTQLGRNTTYRTIFYWFTSITFTLLPLTLIASFNCFLVNVVRQSQVRRKQMTKSQENSSQAQEHRMTLILIAVVILFLFCQTPTACMLIYTTVNPNLNKQTDNLLRGLGNVFNLLMSINAACNFLLYCALSEKYRRTFKALFCERRARRIDTFSTSSMARTTTTSIYPKNAIRRNLSAYVPRKYESQSMTNLPRAKTMIVRPTASGNIGKLV